MTVRFAARATAISIFALACTSPAFAAVEAQKVADAFAQRLSAYNIEMKTASAELQGANVALKGVTFSANGKPLQTAIDVVLENVTEKGDGYVVGKIAAAPNKYTDPQGTFEFGGASINNVELAGPSASELMKAFVVYESIDLQPSRYVDATGTEMFHIGGGKATMSPVVEGQPLTFNMAVNDIYVNTKAAAKSDPKGSEAIAALGLDELKMGLTAKGSWNPADGRLILENETFDAANVGKLDFALDLSGYTVDFIKALQQMSKSAEGNSSAANGMAMMGLAQQLTFHSFKLRFDDASITSKILDYAAKQAGQPKDALAMQIKGMAPMMLMQLQDAEFATAASGAISAFIDSPKSLEIKAAPAQPLPFAVLMSTGMSTPAALIKQLGLTVTANQ